jgi:transposase
MAIRYSEDFKREVTRAYLAGDKSTVEIAADYNIAKSSVSEWARKYGEECQYKHTTTKTEEGQSAAEIRRLNQELKEKEKEIEFLKKAAAFFAREID